MRTPGKPPGPEKSTEQDIDMAAVWLALLRGPRRTLHLERALQKWRAANPDHEAAWETVTSTWDISDRLPHPAVLSGNESARLGYRHGFWRAAVSVGGAAVILAVAVLLHLHTPDISTGIGEQRTLILEDGSRVTLNTDTRLRLHYSGQRRLIELYRGEALFDVVQQGAQRPFVVAVDHREIRALGTSFMVRREAQNTSVTLVEGKVSVAASGEAVQTESGRGATTLNPGERLTFGFGEPPHLDRPSLSIVTAWRQGHVQLDGTPLSAAVAELNRYSEQKIVLDDASLAPIPVTGVFRAGDSLSFARAMSLIYGLHYSVRERELVIQSGAAQGRGVSDR